MPMRSHHCGQVTEAQLDDTITVCGWVNTRRDHGGVIFIDLRDREGILQIVIDPDTPESFALAERVRSEYVLKGDGPGALSPRRHRKPGHGHRQS